MNGQPVALGAMVVQKNGMTMIPLTVVSDLLSAEVEVDEFTQSVHIHTPGKDLGELDYVGRKIRTTNLPKNYKDYPYILEDIRNEMYEMKNSITFYDPKDAMTGSLMYSNKKITSEDMAKIINRMKIGYDLRLNVDYKTIDPASYAKESFKYENQAISYREQNIKEYAEWVKKNKIQIEGSIDPEPSMVYDSGFGWFVRSKFRFRINNYTEYKELLNDTYLKLADIRLSGKLKKGVWYEGYADIAISSNYYDGAGYDGAYGETKNLDGLSSLFENTTLHEMK